MKKNLNDSMEVPVQTEIEKFMDDEMLEMCGGTTSAQNEKEEKTCKCIVFASA